MKAYELETGLSVDWNLFSNVYKLKDPKGFALQRRGILWKYMY